MEAKLLLRERRVISEMAFVEMVVWRLPRSLPKGRHVFKYRLAYVVKGVCVLRYDNETGKGDHNHLGNREIPYVFTTPETLLNDFWTDVENWRPS